jgi:hydrogenase maturation protease
VRALRGRLPREVRIAEAAQGATELLDLWAESDPVIVIDAVRSGHPPGTIHRFDVAREELPSRLGSTSSHGLTLADAIELARSLGHLPRHLTVFGIEAGPVGLHRGLSPPVARAVVEVTERVLLEIRPPSVPPAKE